MTPIPTTLTIETRLERLQKIRANLHEAYPSRRDGILHELVDVCIDQELELRQLHAQLAQNGLS